MRRVEHLKYEKFTKVGAGGIMKAVEGIVRRKSKGRTLDVIAVGGLRGANLGKEVGMSIN